MDPLLDRLKKIRKQIASIVPDVHDGRLKTEDLWRIRSELFDALESIDLAVFKLERISIKDVKQ